MVWKPEVLPPVTSFLQQGYALQTYPPGSKGSPEWWSPGWICIIDMGTDIQGPSPQTHGRWQILSACGRGLKLAKPSSSGPSTSVYRWLITWIQKLASDCSSFLLDVYRLRLLAYKDLHQDELTSPCAVHEKMLTFWVVGEVGAAPSRYTHPTRS